MIHGGPVLDHGYLQPYLAPLGNELEALGLERVHLIAHSWGGVLAMKYAAAHSGRLRSLVLLDPMPPTAALWRDEQRELAASLVAQDTAGAGALRATEAFAEAIPGAHRVTIPATGHFPFVEQPEAFLDAVRTFLARVGVASRA